jgi:phosphoribosylanthranilate isomerase
MIDICTFTGIDVRTDIEEAAALSARYPFIEFGVLLSRTPEDKDARYPAYGEIERIVSSLAGRARLAIHVCGRAVNEFVNGAEDIEALVRAGVGRVQLNFSLARCPFGMEELDAAISRTAAMVITQHFPANYPLALALTSANHQVLFDTSGGRGVEAVSYDPPFAGKYTGYAGGMGPENVAECASRVVAVSKGQRVWIDMENRIRTDGYLDLGKCAEVARIVAPMVVSEDLVSA